MKKRLKSITVWTAVLFASYVVIMLVYGTIVDYQPEDKISLKVTPEASPLQDSTFSFLIWNIGYCGLGAEADFFYHGGGFLMAGSQMVRPPEVLADKYLNGVKSFLQNASADFMLLQEVDYHSKRSYYQDQHGEIASLFPDYHQTKALNLNVSHNPIPVLQPWNAYGHCESGLSTFSRFGPHAADRLQLPGEYSWPTKIYMLDRCLALHRYPLANQKELVVINVHNSAYDKGGTLKAQQMTFLRDLVLSEYEKGNYVIAGGDWNQCPPNFPFDSFMPNRTQGYSQINIAHDFLPPDWQWIYDPTVPTNRKNKTKYEEGTTFITIIDFYLLSPNLQALKVQAYDQAFAWSDHQPVRLELRLK